VIKHFNLWDQELSFTDRLIQEDIRNNSAWNQRYFAIHHHPTPPDDTVLEHEVT
jgi:protein farnesyltransferase/geranylgeranyltransferase type-1 subunit alpha